MTETNTTRKGGGRNSGVPLNAGWKLEDAKARFSEVVRLARNVGPQRVSVRGKDAVVVMSVEDHARLAPADATRPSLVAFMEGLHLAGLDVVREPDYGRDVDL